ncbi:N-acetylmuramic acid 6-phosphate etherase [Pseudovibrio denitrificans]|uniref:N-acetylmuramic acid 6-phosphate etherase n=2 Tax=Pseudovibrio denitrificans TaxID=258256 RepID=A0A1I7CT39_9HYPH|nr:N-acetylmuramic acid 6-phosphate etherase [Pseudovibrio denitrificans]
MSSMSRKVGFPEHSNPREWRETEQRSSRYAGLETWGTDEVLKALLGGQMQALNAVWAALGELETAVDATAQRLKAGEGRLVYVGAGTSGRLGVLDGIELIPTFGWPEERLIYGLAGGEAGLLRPQEGAEDSVEAGRNFVIEHKVGVQDVVLGLAASGTTPFTRAAIQTARASGALTISLANNPQSPLLADAEHEVLLRTGAEVLAGSTRLSAGTSQKAALNLFSTALMVRLNKVYRGYMVDMQLTNDKLDQRAKDMVVSLTGCSQEKAAASLHESGNQIKLAVLLVLGATKQQATNVLAETQGDLGESLQVLGLHQPE